MDFSVHLPTTDWEFCSGLFQVFPGLATPIAPYLCRGLPE